ncbi:MAG: 4-hydroxy-3-methylbut-2-enyl diphosphate reductase [Candidatus Carbobacillus altaicus]|uniref:4-hydroxy-3-methylbut-2-enyl diphosphate reductase n=1 Tax=Candidatus Carbonibacillus altaicus TaxID=2163959 RepID=A0A2R6Y4Z3_9BACL|nr:4-hydroxy-3-methylbut-2-enyl diphosphate reductase [Candidatus Carbobacillus altaicus]PTQ57757.1 MAG: 4-hydroxy-3-methylbut-2-enyl diphosphate reductase [Candidatus Carbobacillus altaicus]
MEVIKITPRGYCYGVVDAMVIARRAAQDKTLPRPIYILGMIVHNSHVVEAFREAGVITVDGSDRLSILDKIERGTVIFTAHGVSPEVRRRAREKGLVVLDATCPDVTRTHVLIEEKVKKGYEVVYIGKKGHPEPEGAIGVAPGHVHLIETASDIEMLSIPRDYPHILLTNQTTMSQWDTADLMAAVLERFPQAEVVNEICRATQVRQEAVAEQAREADLTIVVGDPRSNNSNRLADVSIKIAGTPAYRVADVHEIDPKWLFGKRKVAVTAGASTPTAITHTVIQYLEQFDAHRPETWEKPASPPLNRILPKIKSEV